MRGIDADGIKENVFAHAIAQHFLHLRQPGGLQRACILASGIDQVNDNALALEHVIVKMDFDAILRGENYIGKIACAPAGIVGRRGRWACC